jgi:hypothetical protein
MARAEDERALLPIHTHQHVERFLTFDNVDAQRFSAIFGQLLQDGNFFVKLGFEREGAQRKAYKRAAEQDYVDEIMMVKFAGAMG